MRSDGGHVAGVAADRGVEIGQRFVELFQSHIGDGPLMMGFGRWFTIDGRRKMSDRPIGRHHVAAIDPTSGLFDPEPVAVDFRDVEQAAQLRATDCLASHFQVGVPANHHHALADQ